MGPSANPSADGPAPSESCGGGTHGRCKVREAWEALRGHVRGAVRFGMRRPVVAHSDGMRERAMTPMVSTRFAGLRCTVERISCARKFLLC